MGNDGRFVWFDLRTTDVEAAQGFYREVVGWGTQEWTGGGKPYTMWTAAERPMGGITSLPGELAQSGVPPHWIGYVQVADVDATARRAAELGGEVRVPGTDIPQIGRFAVITDPQGAAVALFKPLDEMAPPDRSASGFVGWHELNTTDHAGAWTFYSALFGWQHSRSMEMGDEWGTYFMFHHPGDAQEAAMGGMFDSAKMMDMPPNWLYYVNVLAIEPALASVRERGGEVLHGPVDVPGGGRAAQCRDPQGGFFAIFSMG